MNTQHTTEPNRQAVTFLACGCTVYRRLPAGDRYFIELCPLHSASPELLAACERINEDIKDRFGYDETTGLHDKSMARSQRLLEQAIAKAEGGNK
jgi:hypothetical protein